MSESTFIAWLLISAVIVEVAGRLFDRRERRGERPRARRKTKP